MKLRTVIEPRTKSLKTGKHKVMNVIAVVLNIILSPMIPFCLGFYFGVTTNWVLFVIFLFLLFIEVHISVNKDGSLKMKIVRGL